MGFLLFVMLLGVVFGWLVVRSVRAGHGRPIAWLTWLVIGCCIVLELPANPSRESLAVVYLWQLGVVGLPVYWTLRWILRASRSRG
jgi:hypothetical protein